MNIYREELLDHFKHPRNHGKLNNPNIDSQEYHPSCGDSVHIEAIANNNVLEKIAFTGKGCVISQSTASILTEFSLGKTLDDILLLPDNLITNMINLKLGPTRAKCAVLSLHALKKGIISYKNSQ